MQARILASRKPNGMQEITKTAHKLKELIGGKLNKIGLSVWPDSDGANQTDVRLYIEFTHAENPRRICGSVICYTDSDGQTPRIEAHLPTDIRPIESLMTREEAWAKADFWLRPSAASHELFSISKNSQHKLADSLNQVIKRASIICFSDKNAYPTGLAIELTNRNRIYSVPDTYGNGVFTSLEHYRWPSPVELRYV